MSIFHSLHLSWYPSWRPVIRWTLSFLCPLNVFKTTFCFFVHLTLFYKVTPQDWPEWKSKHWKEICCFHSAVKLDYLSFWHCFSVGELMYYHQGDRFPCQLEQFALKTFGRPRLRTVSIQLPKPFHHHHQPVHVPQSLFFWLISSCTC